MDSHSPRSAVDKLETWLRYYEDLGIRAFYTDRAIVAQPTVEIIPEFQESMRKPKASPDPPSIPSTDRSTPAASVQPAQATGVARLPGVVQGPSLFEVAERIKDDTLERICSDLGDCTRCKLHRHRNKIVFGVGNPRAELMFVGEGPGHDEDVQGVPFVGRAGQLLTQMILAMGVQRADVYIANVVKCRPPENRTPEKDEVATCLPFLLRQVAAIQPKVIVCLGSVATQSLLGTNKSISSFRGQWLDFRGAKLMATYHPAYLLRNPNAKPEVWGDLKKVMALLGLKPPRRDSARS